MADPVTIDDLVALLKENPGRTCTEIGHRLWHKRAQRKVHRQSFARSAGKLVKRAIAENLVREKLERYTIGTRNPRRTFRRVFYAK